MKHSLKYYVLENARTCKSRQLGKYHFRLRSTDHNWFKYIYRSWVFVKKNNYALNEYTQSEAYLMQFFFFSRKYMS